MATGKTSVGKALAEKINKKFVDLDDLIEKRMAKKIKEIFEQNGEAYFRKLEKETLKEIAQNQNLVIGCGGGLVVDVENLNLLKKTGLVICLSASVDEIMSRSQGTDERPLLNVDNPKARIVELLAKREPFYKQAHFMIDTTNLSIEEVVNKIIQIIKDYE